MDSPVVEFEAIEFSYGRRRVLQELSWSLAPGFTGLLGPNGAGKTTLIKCLVGLAKPSRGRITIDGSELADIPMGTARSRIGYVPQRATAPGHMRVRQIVEYAAWLQGVPSGALGESAQRAVELLGLEDLAARRFRTLSGGERQRVMIGAGVAHRPRILVLDEPTVGLDPSHRLSVRRAIAQLDGIRSVLLSTHMLEDVEHLCSQVGVINDGQVRFSGSLTELLARVAGGQREGGGYGSAFEYAYEALVGEAMEDGR